MKKTTVKRSTVATYIKLKQKTSTKYFSLSPDLKLKLKMKISKDCLCQVYRTASLKSTLFQNAVAYYVSDDSRNCKTYS